VLAGADREETLMASIEDVIETAKYLTR